MSDPECTTDATPQPPRDKENINEGNKKEPVNKGLKKGTGDDNNQKPSQPGKHKNIEKHPTQSLVVNIIHVMNSPHAHVGHTYHHYPKMQEGCKIIETEKMAALKKNKKPVLDVDIDAIKDHIGFGWTETFLQLGFSQPQIEQSQIRFHNDINALFRWLLLDWKQSRGKTGATVDVLAHALWNSNQHIALKIWSLQYDDIHK